MLQAESYSPDRSRTTDKNPFAEGSEYKLELNGVEVLIIADEHDEYDGRIKPEINKEFADPATKAVVIEYFYPELFRNAASNPVVGKQLLTMLNAEDANVGRIRYGHVLADKAARSGKTIATADIANNAGYMIAKILTPYALLGITKLVPETAIATYPLILSQAYYNLSEIAQKDIITSQLDNQTIPESVRKLVQRVVRLGGRSPFNKDYVTLLEQVLPGLEDARRLFVAKAIAQLTEQYRPQEGKPKPKIVVIYPEAHARRIIHYIENQNQAFRTITKLKEMLYRVVPGIEYSVKLWKKSKILEAFIGDSRASWVNFSNETYPLIEDTIMDVAPSRLPSSQSIPLANPFFEFDEGGK